MAKAKTPEVVCDTPSDAAAQPTGVAHPHAGAFAPLSRQGPALAAVGLRGRNAQRATHRHHALRIAAPLE
jgi:hypothetical protein